MRWRVVRNTVSGKYRVQVKEAWFWRWRWLSLTLGPYGGSLDMPVEFTSYDEALEAAHIEADRFKETHQSKWEQVNGI